MISSEARIGGRSRIRALEYAATGLLFASILILGGTYARREYLRHVTAQLRAALDEMPPDTWRIAQLIRQGADVNTRSALWQFTPLTEAAFTEDDALMRLSLARGAQVDAPGNSGRSALNEAAGTPRGLPLVQMLLASGADPNYRSAQGSTPLIVAARFGQTAVMAELLAHGAELERRDAEGRTALLLAARLGEYPSVALLAQHGASLAAVDRHGDGPVRSALRGLREAQEDSGDLTPWLNSLSLFRRLGATK